MKPNKNALLFIFLTMLIDCTGLGIIIPVTPKLIEELTGGDVSEAATYFGWLSVAYAIMQFLFSSVLGGLSDRYGRRPVLLLSLLGLGADYIFLALAPSIFWLFIGRMIAGISGASFTTASAYIADVSEPEKRAQNFGMIGVAFGLGFILGPLIGGLFGGFGTRVPFLIAAGLSLLNAIYGFFVLPESLAVANRRAFDWKRANPVGMLLNLNRYKHIYGLILIIFLVSIAGHAAQSTWTFITMYKFNWGPAIIGSSLAFVGLTVAIVQGGLIRVVIPKIGEVKAIFVGFSFYLIGFVSFAFATEGWMMFAFMVPYALGGLGMPAVQGMISNHVPANEQGEIQGVLTSLMSLTAIIGPLLMTSLFHYFTSKNAPFIFAGAPFMMGALLTLICLGIAIKAVRKADAH